MKTLKFASALVAPVSLLAACASAPSAPTVQVMPGSTKPFEIFQDDQAECRKYAGTQVAVPADAQSQAVAIGSALGGLLNAAGGNTSSNAAAPAQPSSQDQYNNAYVQCMYSKGNQVPGMSPQAMAAPDAAAPPPGAVALSAPPPDGVFSLAQAQDALRALGYYRGVSDGVTGPRTREALRKYQKDHKLPPTGELDPATAAALQH